MKTPETSRNFTRRRDPASGAESLILTGRVAPSSASPASGCRCPKD